MLRNILQILSDKLEEGGKMLKVGQEAPDFVLFDQDNQQHRLSEYRGQRVILYFYPKDNTSGCTKEACQFRDYYPQIQAKDVVVIGISKDNVSSHKKFQSNFALPFILLADPDLNVIKAYDVWVEKMNYGRKYMGIERSTYLIDEKGIIIKTFQKVKAATHVNDVLKAI